MIRYAGFFHHHGQKQMQPAYLLIITLLAYSISSHANVLCVDGSGADNRYIHALQLSLNHVAHTPQGVDTRFYDLVVTTSDGTKTLKENLPCRLSENFAYCSDYTLSITHENKGQQIVFSVLSWAVEQYQFSTANCYWH